LVARVGHALASDLVCECVDLGMRPVPYQDVGGSSDLPPFEAGHQFRFNPDGNEEAMFEILEKDSRVLQAGYQLTFPISVLFAKARKRYNQLKEILEGHYAVGQPFHVIGCALINYGNDATIAYLSRYKAFGRDAVTVRVGNRRFWDGIRS